jgi:hypothetical protein
MLAYDLKLILVEAPWSFGGGRTEGSAEWLLGTLYMFHGPVRYPRWQVRDCLWRHDVLEHLQVVVTGYPLSCSIRVCF